MKILYSWLQEFVELPSAQELEKALNSLGIEVASVEKTGADFEGVFAAKITKIDPHPNADKLSLVTVDTGAGEQRVVCGAKNFKLGDVVPLAKTGARLGADILKPAEIRGVKSEGMLCSSDELGISKTRASGILILEEKIRPGADVKSLFGKTDYILELEITPNRGDLLSHLGIARELAVLFNKPLKTPEIKKFGVKGASLPVRIDNATDCPRYAGRIVRNVKNTESPQWMKDRLLAMDINPKSALIDITNYALHEAGHPLHAFDLTCIEGGEIIVRNAYENEQFVSLDKKTYTLNPSNLVIADAKKASSIAGVTGGAGSGIQENTKDVFIESAYFNPPSINKTSKKLGISTDSSQHFERTTDIERVLWALDRATELMLQICGGEASEVTDVYPVKYTPAVIEFTPAEINKILGVEIPEDKMKEIFSALGSLNTGADKWTFAAPPHRRDLTMKWDLAEEAVRFYGLDKVPSDAISAHVEFADNPANTDAAAALSTRAIAQGFYECKNFDFVSAHDIKALHADPAEVIEIANPLNSDMQYLRPSLISNLLKNIEYNRQRGERSFKLFEIGKEYRLAKGFPAENWGFCAVISGAGQDFFYMKGLAAELLQNTENLSFAPAPAPAFMHPKIYMEILDGKKPAGFLGRLHPSFIKAYGLKNAEVYALYINIKTAEKYFAAGVFKPARPVSPYPPSDRDLSIVVDKAVPYNHIETLIHAAGALYNMKYELIDVYQGPNIAPGKKSMTLRFYFRSDVMTLKDAEVDAEINKIIAALRTAGAELRS